jgi:hypothetical protein
MFVVTGSAPDPIADKAGGVPAGLVYCSGDLRAAEARLVTLLEQSS